MASAPIPVPGSDRNAKRTAERRRSERLQVLLPAKLTLMDGEFDCAIENVSQTGARLICDTQLRAGQQGILRCHMLETLFEVVWTDKNTAGIAFDEDVPLGVIRALRWDNTRNRAEHDEVLTQMVRDWTQDTAR